MSWFSTVKSWFSSDSEEQHESHNRDISEVFVEVCAAKGVGSKYLDETNAVELFKAWYKGNGSNEEVLDSMGEFLEAHPRVNAKLVRFF